MKIELRSSALILVGLGCVAVPFFSGCGDDNQTTTGTTTTTTSQGGGGSGGTTNTTGNGGNGGGNGGAGGNTGGNGGSGGGGGLPTGNYDCTAPDGAPPPLKLTEIADGLSTPLFLISAPGDDTRLFIVERPGRIRIYQNGALEPEPFLDITDRVNQGNDERGLLGLAFHPGYAQNGRFFVYYTDKSGGAGDQIVAEYSRSADPNLATADANGYGTEVGQLLAINDPAPNHNGGMMQFSPVDGFLYIGTGDGGGAGDSFGQFGNAQNLASLWGKILRIDVDKADGGKLYGIPAGNMTMIPMNNPTTGDLQPEIWDYGVRNPWRFSFDPCSGDLYMGDVGQGSWEEINIEPAGQGNKNYGWKYLEGTHDYSTNTVGFDQDNFTPPVDEYPQDVPGGNDNCSVTGGFVYRSSKIPSLRGRYFYGDYCSGRIWSFRWDGTAIQDKVDHTMDLGNAGQVFSFGQDSFGNVYVLANDRVSILEVE